MTSKTRFGKILLFVLLLSMVAGLVPVSLADDPCEGGIHKGPYTYTVTLPATCTQIGYQDKYCSTCGKKIGTEEILPIGHQYEVVYDVTTPATCLTDGLRQKKSICRVCGYQESIVDEVIPALGHDWGDWVQTTAPTCETKGQETCTCKRDSSHVQYRDVDPIGHKWDSGVVTKEPTCTEPGEKTYTCQNDSSHIKTEPVPATGHKWDSGVVTKEPTCTEEGEKTFTCQNDPSHTKTEAIPATGHKWDNGTVIKEATIEETGLIHYVCQNDPSHTKDEVIPKIAFPNNTLCAFGPHLRDSDVSSIIRPFTTDVWYMFTPFDASKDGRQTFDLIAANKYIVGTLTLTIKDGQITVDYTLNSNTITVTLEFFTILPQLTDITVYEPEQLLDLNMRVRTPIDLQETFGDDRNLVLYFCSRVDYTYSNKFVELNYDSPANQLIRRQMMDMMDR